MSYNGITGKYEEGCDEDERRMLICTIGYIMEILGDIMYGEGF